MSRESDQKKWRPDMTKPMGRGRAVKKVGTGASHAQAADNGRQEPQNRLDDLDRQIVRILQKNGRTSNTDIAKNLGVTETTIRKRIAQLLEEGMMHIVAVPTPKAVGGNVSALIGLSVSLRAIHVVSQRLRACREVRYVGMSAGRYDIIIEIFAQDQERLLEFITEKLGAIEGITSVETSLILKMEKFAYEWEVF
ncbi:MAG: Lrp/AsnC family transcriptional regulator [Acidimicrobiia bacterium]|nr:Lrp/AsnC family transcriptional regulator [Acidimicrobiia bacterium]